MSSAISMVALISSIMVASALLLPMYFGNLNLMPPAFAQNSKGDVNSYYSLAVEAIERGMYQEAVGYLDRVLAIEPDNVDALLKKGEALSYLGRYEEELQNYDRVLAIEPDNVDALFNKGGALLDLGKYEEAIEYFDRVLASEPDAVDALNNKGVASYYIPRKEEAKKYFDEALRIDSDNDEASKNSHLVSLSDGDILYARSPMGTSGRRCRRHRR